MPLIDVTELLIDADLTDTFDVTRRMQTVNAFGETTVALRVFSEVPGAVYPTGDQSLARMDAYQSQNDTITVVTTFRLRGVSTEATGDYQPDIVTWQGNDFVIRTLNAYNYGNGFVVAECISTRLLDQPDPEQS